MERDYEEEDKKENIYQDMRDEIESSTGKLVWSTPKPSKEYNEEMEKKTRELLDEARHLTYRERN